MVVQSITQALITIHPAGLKLHLGCTWYVSPFSFSFYYRPSCIRAIRPQKHNGNDTILVAEYGLRPLETPRVEQEETRMVDDKTSKQTHPEVKDGPRHGYYPPTLHTTE